MMKHFSSISIELKWPPVVNAINVIYDSEVIKPVKLMFLTTERL